MCVCIRNEVEATGNVKSPPVVDPDTGNISVLSQMEAADENLSLEADGEWFKRTLAFRKICCAYDSSEQTLPLPWLGIIRAVAWNAL